VSHSPSELSALWQALEQKLLSLLEQLKQTLRPETYEFALEETDAREYGVALHAICDELQKYGVPVPRKIYEQIEEVSRMMEMPEDTWTSLIPEPRP
jgi:hypothetical protein